MDYLDQAILKLKPNSEFTYSNRDYSTIQWHVLDGEAPSKAQIDAAIKQIKIDEEQEKITKAEIKTALLNRLGITADEAVILLS